MLKVIRKLHSHAIEQELYKKPEFKTRPNIKHIEKAYDFIYLNKFTITVGLPLPALGVNIINFKKIFFERTPFGYLMESYHVQD